MVVGGGDYDRAIGVLPLTTMACQSTDAGRREAT